MRVVPQNKVSTVINGHMGNLPLVVGDYRRYEMYSPVYREYYKIRISLRSFYIVHHSFQVTAVGKTMHTARGTRLIMLDLLVERMAPDRSTAGTVFFSPVSVGQDGIVGQERQAHSFQLYNRRAACLPDVGPDSHDRQPLVLKYINRVKESLPSQVHAMIARKGDHCEPRLFQRPGHFRLSPAGKPRLRQGAPAVRKIGLQLAEHHISCLQKISDACEDRRGIIAIRCYIAHCQQNQFFRHPVPSLLA